MLADSLAIKKWGILTIPESKIAVNDTILVIEPGTAYWQAGQTL